jgi:hypothetical protein
VAKKNSSVFTESLLNAILNTRIFTQPGAGNLFGRRDVVKWCHTLPIIRTTTDARKPKKKLGVHETWLANTIEHDRSTEFPGLREVTTMKPFGSFNWNLCAMVPKSVKRMGIQWFQCGAPQ